MSASAPQLQRFVDAHRAWVEGIFSDIRALSASPAPRRGVTRLGYTEKESEVMAALEGLGRGMDLEISRDPAGNLWMTLPGEDRTLPGIVAGSHADSVYDGGNYDGLAGIAAALCAVRSMKLEGVTPKRDVSVVVLRAEEQGLIGSKGMMGRLTAGDLGQRWRPGMPTLRELLEKEGLDPAALSGGRPLVDPKRIGAFFELHIEQGLRLCQPGGPRVALVTGIRGLGFQRVVRVTGEAGHAGAIDFEFRHDPLVAASRLIAHMYERWAERVARGEDLVFTTGMFNTPPTAIFNKIPQYVEFSLDFRTLDRNVRDSFFAEMKAEATRLEAIHGVTFDFGEPGFLEPMKSDPALLKRLDAAAASLGIPILYEPSGAGHDAQTFGLEGIKFAMLFVANQNGSHNPDEAMRTDDFLAAAAVLAKAIRDFDAQ